LEKEANTCSAFKRVLLRRWGFASPTGLENYSESRTRVGDTKKKVPKKEKTPAPKPQDRQIGW